MIGSLGVREHALVELGTLLRDRGYQFTTVTPETHRRVLARPAAGPARTLRDVFGWSRSFAPDALPPALLAALDRADA
ncbi:MAG: SAM-dependent methyltransferase, partial [Deltaproteobacteria bacterium]|nr:SAM-dependent methyltransferase [Deltaproteobacteria bacterium]